MTTRHLQPTILRFLLMLMAMSTAGSLFAQNPQSEEAVASEKGNEAPGVTPEATPTPRPTATPVPITYFAPLSLQRCLNLIDQALEILPSGREHFDIYQDSPSSIRRMVASSYNYMQFRDDLHTSLSKYEWVPLNEKPGKVNNDPGFTDNDSFLFDPPVLKISALSLNVEVADAYLHKIVVVDENDQIRETFTINPPKLLQHSLPKREVFHIWRRTTISRIDLEYSRANPGPSSPEVSIEGGITDQPEHIKSAIFCLKRAEKAIEADNVPAATDNLRMAREYLSDFIEQVQRR